MIFLLEIIELFLLINRLFENFLIMGNKFFIGLVEVKIILLFFSFFKDLMFFKMLLLICFLLK